MECLKKKEILFLRNDKKILNLILNLNINENIARVSVKKSKMNI